MLTDRFFMPDIYLNDIYEITPEMLKERGIKAVLLDIDNTLEPYEHAYPGEHVKIWLKALAESGISCAFVSNNDKERVELFNGELALPAYYKAGNPFKKNVLRAMLEIGSDISNTILMGDHVFTDVWAARNAGIKAALVPPINDKKDILTKFKRLLEKPVLRKYERIKK